MGDIKKNIGIVRSKTDQINGRRKELQEFNVKANDESTHFVDGKPKEVVTNTRRGVDESGRIDDLNLKLIIRKGKRFGIKEYDIRRYVNNLHHSKHMMFKYEMTKLGIVTPEHIKDPFVQEKVSFFIRRFGLPQYKSLR